MENEWARRREDDPGYKAFHLKIKERILEYCVLIPVSGMVKEPGKMAYFDSRGIIKQ